MNKFRYSYFRKMLKYFFKRIFFGVQTHSQRRVRRYIRDYGYRPDLVNPILFSEKIAARIVFDKNPLHTKLADKLAVREYVTERIGAQYCVPLLGTYNNYDEIDFNILPDKFVIKCSHDSGSSVICTSKSSFDYNMTKYKINYALHTNMYYKSGELHYKKIQPRILIEEYLCLLDDYSEKEIPVLFRLHCFDGQVHYIETEITNINGQKFINVYDRNWNLQPFELEYPRFDVHIVKPTCLDEALLLAQRLSVGIDYCRVDLYMYDEFLYFSEITFTPSNGNFKIYPQSWDLTWGERWNLSIHLNNNKYFINSQFKRRVLSVFSRRK